MGCTDSDACNYDIDASIDNGSCQYPNTGFDCLGVCLDDDQDGICNVDEILGCTDDSATNYNSNADNLTINPSQTTTLS